MAGTTITIDMDRACSKCGAMGATQSGYCLKCAGERFLRRMKGASMTVLRRYTSTLDCELTEKEVLAYGRELASINAAISTEESSQISVKKEMASRLAGLEAKASEISAKVNRGKELREVQIAVTADFKKGTATEFRTDTGEVYRERPLRDDERQPGLPSAQEKASHD